MQPMSFAQFQQAAMHGNVIPVAESMLADMFTPVAAFMKLCGYDEDGFLLESVEGGEKIARYSFLGWRPRKQVNYRNNQIEIITKDGREQIDGDIFSYLKENFQQYKFVRNPELPRFCGGMVGYFGYDTIRLIEEIPTINPVLSDRPEASLGFYDTILAFDRVRHQILIIANAILEEGTNLRASYDDARARIAEIKEALRKPLEIRSSASNGHVNVKSNFKESDFCEAVRKGKEYIRNGDIFQVVLSQRFSRPLSVPSIDVYRALRIINPSPYLFYVRNGNHSIAGSSPELLVRAEDGEVVVRPIAGTRPRGKSAAEDLRLEEDLLADKKELAEHAMLLDLGRNDVGRVTDYGQVNISEKMIIERYSHVMHIVSEVRGRDEAGRRCHRYAESLFPGRNGFRCAKSAGDGNHRRAGAGTPRSLCRCARLLRFFRKPRYLYHDTNTGSDR